MLCHAMITRPLQLPAPQVFVARPCQPVRASSRRVVVCAVRVRKQGFLAACLGLNASKTNFIADLKQQICNHVASAFPLVAVLTLTSLPCNGTTILANKPTFASDYATVVRKREGKSKSNLPSAREAEALLEVNEDLFTTEALEGMSRCATVAYHQSCPKVEVTVQ